LVKEVKRKPILDVGDAEDIATISGNTIVVHADLVGRKGLEGILGKLRK